MNVSYGASIPKFASTLGLETWEGEEAYENFWKGNPALKQLKDHVTAVWEQSGKKSIVGIDGRKLFSRSKHSLVNLLFQGCGAVIMEYSLIFLDKWLGGLVLDKSGSPCYSYKGQYVYRVGAWHDEGAAEAPDDLAEEIKTLGVKSIEYAGRHLKIRVPLTGSGKVGTDWCSVH